jgi:hypothetical protein
MEKAVGEHLRDLEQRLNLLSARMMDEDNGEKRNRLKAELRAVESALTHYRSALEIERRFSES